MSVIVWSIGMLGYNGISEMFVLNSPQQVCVSEKIFLSKDHLSVKSLIIRALAPYTGRCTQSTLPTEDKAKNFNLSLKE